VFRSILKGTNLIFFSRVTADLLVREQIFYPTENQCRAILNELPKNCGKLVVTHTVYVFSIYLLYATIHAR
jgi:hypothetical protein